MNECRKVRKFKWGIHPEIRQQLYVFKLSTYSAVLTKAASGEKLSHLSSSNGKFQTPSFTP